jgi:3-keto-disaccharide hydrolase
VIAGLLLLLGTSFGQGINSLSSQEKEEGWQLLFDGKTLQGWHSSAPPEGRGLASGSAAPKKTPPPVPGPMAQTGSNPRPCSTELGKSGPVPKGGSHWEIVDGLLMPCAEPTGYLTSDKSYKNFVLSIEFMCGEDTNSGVFLHAANEAGGYEVQIWKQQPAGYNTGAIVGTAKTARPFNFNPNQWNRYQITVDGDHIVVVLNGEITLDIHDTKFPEGNFRLQYQKFPIAFRNIKLRPLP